MTKRNFVEPSGTPGAMHEMAEERANQRYMLVLEKIEEDARMFSLGAQEVNCELLARAVDQAGAHEIVRTHNLCIIVLCRCRFKNAELCRLKSAEPRRSNYAEFRLDLTRPIGYGLEKKVS